jgi:2'-hydroxyisoflavone reductase
VRPTYVVGPGDDTDRFTYWVDRVARGGDVLAPPDPEATLQWIDVRDLCPWIVALAEQDEAGLYNAAGPPMRWRDLLPGIATAVSARPVQPRWATREALQAAGVTLPLVRPPGPDPAPTFDGTRAQAAGLAYRPLADTATATLDWWRSQSADRRERAENWPTESQEREALRRLAEG